MPATFHVDMAKRRDDGWYHPKHNFFLKEITDDDFFVFEAIDADTDKTLITFVLGRDCLEQICDNCKDALEIPPLKVRKCLS